ncbi:OmpA/MotB domain-containing protein [Novosphingobium sp. Rr 2-17]|uniref:flagellar motor protein MotB n=1 Tax=Novosphingobium sp. Rr 2-17 TaxID=555793 RepID=UPI0002699217|nr:flagellar motor protein MotB [Novosphingobium sp. Rr 2-17]EIZ78705.1 OmpA/MotB domain-containing protein [Novosphingobium sp. Rr 2-17]
MALASKANQQPIVIRKVKKGGHAAHHGGAWKVAYADFVTAMMAFFMLLWLLANPDKERLKGLAEYFSPAPPSALAAGMAPSPGDQAGLGGRTRREQADSKASTGQPSAAPAKAGSARGGTANVPDASMRVMAEEMRVTLEAGDDAKSSVKIEPDRNGVRISLMDTAGRSMFVGGTAQLNPFARAMLGAVARKLVKSGAQIAIEGHTDAVGGQSDANWRLSSERALAARSAMIEAGLTADRFDEVVALAGTQPIYPGQPTRPENRRITIVALGEAPTLPSDASFKF